MNGTEAHANQRLGVEFVFILEHFCLSCKVCACSEEFLFILFLFMLTLFVFTLERFVFIRDFCLFHPKFVFILHITI